MATRRTGVSPTDARAGAPVRPSPVDLSLVIGTSGLARSGATSTADVGLGHRVGNGTGERIGNIGGTRVAGKALSSTSRDGARGTGVRGTRRLVGGRGAAAMHFRGHGRRRAHAPV